MQLDFSTLTEYQRYKLMASLIVPRPIALVTTINAQGVVNAAPFSLFNMLGEEPPIVMISLNKHSGNGTAGALKDTAANILANGEFVVHLADEAIAEQMHACGASLPPDQSEVELVGFTTQPSNAVRPPRIAEAPVAFECKLWETLETDSRYIFIGKVLWLHARDELIDLETHRVRLQNYFPVARFGASFYINTRERYALGGKGDAGEAPRATTIDEI